MVEKKRRRPLVRLIRFAIIASVSVVLFYLIGVNVFLSTSLFTRFVDAQPDVVDIHFERAWSIFPQHVHAKKLSIRGRDGNVEWIVKLDEAEVDIALVSLLKMRFEGSHVRGKGLSFRLRQRPDVAPSAEELATMPTIDGLRAVFHSAAEDAVTRSVERRPLPSVDARSRGRRRRGRARSVGRSRAL